VLSFFPVDHLFPDEKDVRSIQRIMGNTFFIFTSPFVEIILNILSFPPFAHPDFTLFLDALYSSRISAFLVFRDWRKFFPLIQEVIKRKQRMRNKHARA